VITKAAGRLGHMANFLARDPGQIRYMPEWRKTLGRSTLDSEMPWLPYRVLDRIEAELDSSSRVFEYGGGGSTVWLSKRVAQVITVEHDPGWAEALTKAVATRAGCDVLYRSADNDYADYVNAINDWPDDHFDAVIVDGRQRVRCARTGIPKVKPGGLLILDDTNRDRYRPIFDELKWPNVTYAGLTPSKTLAGVTTVWKRPAAG
jgi:hypothetical protein